MKATCQGNNAEAVNSVYTPNYSAYKHTEAQHPSASVSSVHSVVSNCFGLWHDTALSVESRWVLSLDIVKFW